MKNTRILLLLVVLLCFMAVPGDVQAQCPMCKTSVESGLKEGNSVGLGLNDGILYLLAAPYVLVGSVGIVWYRAFRRKKRLAGQQ